MAELVSERWPVESTFSLTEAYELTEQLARLYPENHHLKDSVRVGIQHLRRVGILEMLEPGVYRRVR